MTDKEAILILTEMLEKYPLSADEREAIKSSIGILGWTKMLENKKTYASVGPWFSCWNRSGHRPHLLESTSIRLCAKARDVLDVNQ